MLAEGLLNHLNPSLTLSFKEGSRPLHPGTCPSSTGVACKPVTAAAARALELPTHCCRSVHAGAAIHNMRDGAHSASGAYCTNPVPRSKAKAIPARHYA